MATRWIAFGVGIVAIVLLAGSKPIAHPDLVIDVQEVNPFTSTAINDNPRNFQFAIVADRTGGMRPGVFAKAVGKLNLLQPQFVMCVGDLIQGYTEDAATIAAQRNEFDAMVRNLQMPFFYTVGNHDSTNAVLAAEWTERYGRSYYHFIYRDVLFCVVNTEDGGAGKIGDEQAAYFRKVLADNPAVRWTMVFMHKPLWEGDTGDNPRPSPFTPIAEALGDRPYTVIAGHYHTYTKYQRRGRDYYTLATTGGASRLSGALEGQFDHLVWVTMTDTGPRMANLMLDGIYDDSIRDEKLAAMLSTLERNPAVSVGATFIDRPAVGGTTVGVTLRNSATGPVRIQGKVVSKAPFMVSPDTFDRTLAPGDSEPITLAVMSTTGIRSGMTPASIEWSASYDMPGRDEPVTITDVSPIGMTSTNAATRRTAPVVIDGKLDDWSKLPYECTKPEHIKATRAQWHGEADSSFRFAVEYDDQFVYLAVRVIDDQLVPVAKAPWSHDGIEIRLDGRPEHERSANRGGGDFDDHLFFALVPGDEAEPMFTFQPKRLPADVKYACRKSDTGFVTEVAVPVSYFTKLQGNDWQGLRLNIAVDDHDPAEDAKQWSQIWWQSDWRNAESLPGSGTFRVK